MRFEFIYNIRQYYYWDMVGRLGQDCQHRLRNAPFWLESKDESSLDDGLSIVYTEAEIRRPRPFIPSKFSDVLEAWFVPIISVKILLHILVKSRKKIICQLRKKFSFCISWDSWKFQSMVKLKVLYFYIKRGKMLRQKRMISFLIVFFKSLFFKATGWSGVIWIICRCSQI